MDDLLKRLSSGSLSDPVVLGVAAVIVVVLVAIVFKISRVGKGKRRKVGTGDAQADRLIKAGNYEAAANRLVKTGDFGGALEWFLKAQNPRRAAQMAERMGNTLKAAELYELASDKQQAAKLYKAAGMNMKAAELSGRPVDQKSALEEAAMARSSEDELLTPQMRARKAESKFIDAHNLAKTGDAKSLNQLENLGKEAVEALLSAGETRRAAEICVDAGLYDQAINLFVNLLGDPGSAAVLLAKRGDHKRAAELYEAAGVKERALGEWVDWSDKAKDPLENISQVERLGDDNLLKFLTIVVKKRPLAKNTVDLHYRVADALAEREKAAPAISVLENIYKAAPNFRDVKQKIVKLKVSMKAAAEKEAAQKAAAAKAEAKRADLGTARTLFDRDGEQNQGLAKEDVGTAKTMFDSKDSPSAEESSSDDGKMSMDQLVDSESIERLVNEVAVAAAREATSLAWSKRPSQIPISAAPDSPAPKSTSKRMTRPTAHGIEKVEITLELANDDAVKAAKTGPSAEEYHRMIGDSAPDLENIDLFYRLGLAFAAAGQWIDARSAFETVNRAKPGYLDASKRAEELRLWEQTVPSFVSGESFVSDNKDQRYKLLGEIGRGGMAVVYRARDEELERDVALKFLDEQISSDVKMLDMFKREARSAAQLNHPNIVTVYDVGRMNGRDFICMELVAGVTVEKILEDSGQRMRVVEALRIIEGVLNALEYAHSKNIIHRDIKPSNMMRNDLGVVKIMDFGLAKSIDAKVKKSTIIAGTPSYMPPEQFTGKDMDATSDLFAVGASLYEMLAGEPPFLTMERSAPPRPLSEINPTVPRMLDRLIHRSMEFDKKKRYKSAKEMLKPIRRILASVSAFIDKQRSHE